MKFSFVCKPDEVQSKIEDAKRSHPDMILETFNQQPANQDPNFVFVEVNFKKKESNLLHDQENSSVPKANLLYD